MSRATSPAAIPASARHTRDHEEAAAWPGSNTWKWKSVWLIGVSPGQPKLDRFELELSAPDFPGWEERRTMKVSTPRRRLFGSGGRMGFRRRRSAARPGLAWRPASSGRRRTTGCTDRDESAEAAGRRERQHAEAGSGALLCAANCSGADSSNFGFEPNRDIVRYRSGVRVDQETASIFTTRWDAGSISQSEYEPWTAIAAFHRPLWSPSSGEAGPTTNWPPFEGMNGGVWPGLTLTGVRLWRPNPRTPCAFANAPRPRQH